TVCRMSERSPPFFFMLLGGWERRGRFGPFPPGRTGFYPIVSGSVEGPWKGANCPKKPKRLFGRFEGLGSGLAAAGEGLLAVALEELTHRAPIAGPSSIYDSLDLRLFHLDPPLGGRRLILARGLHDARGRSSIWKMNCGRQPLEERNPSIAGTPPA